MGMDLSASGIPIWVFDFDAAQTSDIMLSHDPHHLWAGQLCEGRIVHQPFDM
jgi:hypothetical protein